MFPGRAGPLLALAAAIASRVQGAPRIQHKSLECIEPGRFAVVLSAIDPDAEIQMAKVYFRSSLYPDFYYVEMAREGDRFVGVLPQVSPETRQVIYYVEALDTIFESGRSAEFDPLVEDPCDDDPGAAYLPGNQPAIVVGATASGAAPLPPGFSAVGIVGTITAAGVSPGLGGGIGVGTAVGVAAGAAGAAGAIVVTNSGGNEPPPTTTTIAAAVTSTIMPVTTSVLVTSTSTAASTSTTSVPPATTTAPPGGSTTTSPPTSTTTSPATSTTTAPPSSTTTSAPPQTTSTVATTTTTVPPPNAACFTVTVVGDCRVRLDATCISPPADQYDWVLDVNDEWDRETVIDGPASLTHTFDDCDDEDENITFRLTAFRDGSSSTASKTIRVPGEDDLKSLPAGGSFQIRAHLQLPPFDSSSRARVLVNGTLAGVVDSSHPRDLRASAIAGTNRVEVFLAQGGNGSGQFRFGFEANPLPVETVQATAGNLLAAQSDAVVFHLTGQAGEHLAFTFELDP